MSEPPIKFKRPDVERYADDAIRHGKLMQVKIPTSINLGLPDELKELAAYRGKDEHSVIFELCCYIRQLELERTNHDPE